MSTIYGLDFVSIENQTHTQGINYFGDTFKFTFGKYKGIFPNYWATLQYKFGNMTDFENVEGLVRYKNLSWATRQLSLDLMTHVPNATSVKVTFKLITYETADGPAWESTTKTLTLNVPSSIKPRMTGISVNLEKPFNDRGVDKLLKGVSRLEVLLSGSNINTYGSTIKERKAFLLNVTTGTTRTLTTPGNTIIVADLMPGQYRITGGTVKDSRGRTSSTYTPETAIEFEVLEYVQPILSQAWARRVSLDENDDPYPDPTGGKYIQVYANITTSGDIFNINLPVAVTVTRADGGGSIYNTTLPNMELNEGIVLSDDSLNPKEFEIDRGWRVRLTALDKVVSDSQYGLLADYRLLAIHSTTVLIHGLDYVKGMAFGKYAEEEGVAEFSPEFTIKKKGAYEADFVTDVSTENGMTELELLSGLKLEQGFSLSPYWTGTKIKGNVNGVSIAEKQDACYSEDGYYVQEHFSGRKEQWRTANDWTELKLISGMKIAVRSFSLTNVSFPNASGAIYQTDYIYIQNPPFIPTHVFVMLRGGVRWVVNARYIDNSANNANEVGIRMRFASGVNTVADELTGSILIIRI